MKPAQRTDPGIDPRTDPQALEDARVLADIERFAVRLAHAAGSRILSAASSRAFSVHFKAPRAGHAADSNPVSDVDREVEALVRTELAARYPDHAVIGEEGGADDVREARFVWAVDPIDGTTNFVNGLPLAGSSIGVLRDGRPVVGAIWCATTHAMHPGIYHAHRGGALCFDGAPLVRRSEAPWRRVAGESGGSPQLGEQWDLRVLGAATVEIAFTAAGLLEIAHVARPSLWDAAAGMALLAAAGCAALTCVDGAWVPLERFEGELAAWCQPLLAGDERALQRAAEILSR